VDAAGNAYVGGYSGLAGFPTTLGCYQPAWNGGFDATITKLNPTGTALVYSTYLGGPGLDRSGMGIAIDAAGNAYICGFTDGSFPTTAGAYQTVYGGGVYDAFVTKLNPTGTAPLVYSTYLGSTGNDYGMDIAVCTSGNVYLTGYTTGSFPTTAGAYQTTYGGGAQDAFFTELNSTGTAPLVYSTYLGGTGADIGQGIAADTSCCAAYLTGYTNSTNFPTTLGAYDTNINTSIGSNAFISKFQMAVPTVISINPNCGGVGQTLNVIITGTCFSAPATANFGNGITVNTVTVNSATQITANITIANNAQLGARNVAVTTPGGTATVTNGFTVNQTTQTVNAATGTGPVTFAPSQGCVTGLTPGLNRRLPAAPRRAASPTASSPSISSVSQPVPQSPSPLHCPQPCPWARNTGSASTAPGSI
jgi:hypothetical protein